MKLVFRQVFRIWIRSLKIDDSIRASNSVALFYDSESIIRIRVLRIMIRIRDSDSVIQNLLFGFSHSEFMIRIRDSPNHHEVRFVDHWLRTLKNNIQKIILEGLKILR